ncbi:DUF5330 domain-containing protein [Xanthobacter dioxanivorans]|uniref:DUF5330 domain-containing protein n=1 Tax=Xanthobacter dioxanivorans TaxID=2528964 RepID=A0A974PN37_9HYPH|nr:DUF5330 domain-containing protein [Xanthobacter dioxanivorans]QRG06366.1 DUF5330 domain-containing protein [Xanthobacter dioxanivorans]
MFFLFRLAFWIGLVLLLLPLGLKGSDGQAVSVFDALGAAQSVVADMRGFCERQPQACAVGGQMATHLAEKAQVGAKWLYQALGSTERENPPAGVPGPSPAGQSGALELTPQDLLPAWGGGENGRTVTPGNAPQPAAPTGPPLPPRRPA